MKINLQKSIKNVSGDDIPGDNLDEMLVNIIGNLPVSQIKNEEKATLWQILGDIDRAENEVELSERDMEILRGYWEKAANELNVGFIVSESISQELKEAIE